MTSWIISPRPSIHMLRLLFDKALSTFDDI